MGTVTRRTAKRCTLASQYIRRVSSTTIYCGATTAAGCCPNDRVRSGTAWRTPFVRVFQICCTDLLSQEWDLLSQRRKNHHIHLFSRAVETHCVVWILSRYERIYVQTMCS